MEKFPRASYSPETKASNERYDAQAKAANNNRPITERILGTNKVSGMDVLRDEADEVNSLVDRQHRHESYHEKPPTTHQDAADAILAGDEFTPATKTVQTAELIRAKYPELDKAIEYVNISAALRLAADASEYMGGAWSGNEARETFEKEVRTMLRSKVDTLIRMDMIPDLVKILENNDARKLADAGITPLFARLPDELIYNPANDRLRSTLIDRFGHALNRQYTYDAISPEEDNAMYDLYHKLKAGVNQA